MRTNSKAAGLAVAVGALALAGCGSGDEEKAAAPPHIPAATASRLATMSDRIASDLDAGDICGAAAQADDLSDAVDAARLPERFADVSTVATDLVNQVNCPPPPEPEKEKKDKEHGKDGNKSGPGDGGEDYGDAQLPGYGDLPPGQAKKIGDGD